MSAFFSYEDMCLTPCYLFRCADIVWEEIWKFLLIIAINCLSKIIIICPYPFKRNVMLYFYMYFNTSLKK